MASRCTRAAIPSSDAVPSMTMAVVESMRVPKHPKLVLLPLRYWRGCRQLCAAHGAACVGFRDAVANITGDRQGERRRHRPSSRKGEVRAHGTSLGIRQRRRGGAATLIADEAAL